MEIKILYNEELYRLYDETDLVTSIRITRLIWVGHIVRMQDNLPCKKITLDKPEDRRRVGRPNLRWMDGWSDEGCREVGSQKLEDQGQGQRCLEAITRVRQDPAWVAAPRWMDGWMDGWLGILHCTSSYASASALVRRAFSLGTPL
jgi:hypothetical protein